MVTRATSRIVVPTLPLTLIGSPVGFSKRSQRNRFPITARFERLPLSPDLSESCAVCFFRPRVQTESGVGVIEAAFTLMNIILAGSETNGANAPTKPLARRHLMYSSKYLGNSLGRSAGSWQEAMKRG